MNSGNWYNFATEAYRAGSYDEALECFKNVSRDWPEHDIGKAKALVGKKFFESALFYADAAVEEFAFNPEAWQVLGLALERLGRFEEARDAYDKALELNPDTNPSYYQNTAYIREMLGDYEGAKVGYQTCASLFPSHIFARLCLGMCQMRLGEWDAGLANYEFRLALYRPLPTNGKPIWNGEEIAGRRLAIYAEQGLGDTIQFLPLAKQIRTVWEPSEIVLYVQDELVRLTRLLYPGFTVSTVGSYYPHDLHVSVMSLFRIFLERGLNPFVLRPAIPCRDGDIGICWKGNHGHLQDHWRSAKLDDFRPISDVFKSVSLQHGAEAEATQAGLRIIPKGDLLDLMKGMINLRAVVTVDTAVAHLAGSMGIPTAILITPNPDWRWSTSGDTTPWYQSVRLFRQEKWGDWSGPVAKAKEWLESL
jgi:hypothetical protein